MTPDELLAALGPAGLRVQRNGHVVLTGPLYRLAAGVDTALTELSGLWDAAPEEHPAMLDAAVLQSTGYLTSFPQLATFPVCLDPDTRNLEHFADGDPLDRGAVRLTATAPVSQVLTPAACYHLYPHHRGEALDEVLHLTTRNTCFRRETAYEPLRRQWSFRMREIVCLGGRSEVTDFLADARETVSALLRALDLPADWAVATDPFFRPARSAKYLAQRVQPVKHEALFEGDLALASVNLHEDCFGAAFDITRNGGPATTGCVAFGIERWLHALVRRHGPRPSDWPDPANTARGLAASLGATPAVRRAVPS
ncbi:MAG: hypothetical protein ACRDQF_00040 [Thermocrispum sp.]